MVKHTLRKAVNDCKETVEYLKDMGEYEGARNWLKTQRDYEQALNMIERAEEDTPTSQEQLATPAVVGRSESFVCGHPPKETYLLDGTWHCKKCGGKWESIANK